MAKIAFEHINNNLWVYEYALIEAGISVNYYRKEKSEGSKRMEFMNHPKDSRISLVSYETIGEKHKAMLVERWKCPYEYTAKQPIRNMIIIDAKAEDYYKNYRYGGGKELPQTHRHRYTMAASWLNLLVQLNTKKQDVKKQLGLTIESYWKHVLEIIKLDNIELPTSYRRLTDKVRLWTGLEGNAKYESIIDWKFGNKLSAKIGKTADGYDADVAVKQEAVIEKVMRLPNNLDAEQITAVVNPIFEKNGWATITSRTIINKLAQNATSITAGRRGLKVYNNEVAMQVARQRSTHPLHYLTLDGWTVELLYQDAESYTNRMVVVVVLDAMNDYPLGYAISERENTDLIRQALRDALTHTKELFGEMYRPWQLQSDRYGMKTMLPFYEALAHVYTPAAVGNAKAKVVEPYFKRLNKKYCQLEYNWSGFNITASKKNQPNTEYLDKIKHSFPTKEGVLCQIDEIIAKERYAKVDTYLAKWQELTNDDKIQIAATDALMIYGKQHKELNIITGQGLIATLDGVKHTFDSFEPEFRALQASTKFKIIYNEQDLSQVVAITEDNKQKFVLHNKMKVGMGYKNQTPAQLEYLNKIKQYNSQQMDKLLTSYIDNDNIVDAVIANTPFNLDDKNEAALKLMLTYKGEQKEKLQDAKGLKKMKQKMEKVAAQEAILENEIFETKQLAYIQQQTDVSQYL